MTIKELRFVVRTSAEGGEAQALSLASAPVGLVAEMLAAIVTFARETGADIQRSEVGFFEGSLGIVYQPDAVGQTYEFPTVQLGGEDYQGGFRRDDPYYVLIHRAEVVARKHGVDIDVTGGNEQLHITPSRPAGLQVKEDVWLTTELSLYGEVMDVGGQNPNIHLLGEDGRKYTISVTRQQATEFRVYQRYYVRIEAKMLLDDETHLRDARLLDYEWLTATPQITAAEFVRREEKNWQGVGNAVDWVRQRRRDADDE